jgi:diguanylate cyclase (GGDEF)-like protein
MDRRVLVVDDDRLIRELARDTLVADGYQVSVAGSGAQALSLLAQEGPFELVLTDLSMREVDGLQLLEQIKRRYTKTDVVILTAYASLETALEAMRLGAADYLRKPLRPAEMSYCVSRVFLRRQILAENESLRGCLQAFEASRVLSTCVELADVLPMALDILLRLVGRSRAVGRLVNPSPRLSDGVYLRGFDDATGAELRELVEQGKLFDTGDLEGPPREAPTLPRELVRFGVSEEGALAIPMRLGGRIVGGIWLFPEGRSFDPAERRQAEVVIAEAELALQNAERFLVAREKAFIDDVTDLYNARYLFAALDREVSRAARTALELSILFLDVDRFKQVNDQYGHLVGSRVLRELGQLFHRSVRSIDTVGRYGGDEFTIVLVDTGFEAAQQVADRIRQSVETRRFGADHGLRIALTVSAGVATFPHHGRDRERLLDISDKAMYLAKSLGRNRVCTGDDLLQKS